MHVFCEQLVTVSLVLINPLKTTAFKSHSLEYSTVQSLVLSLGTGINCMWLCKKSS